MSIKLSKLIIGALATLSLVTSASAASTATTPPNPKGPLGRLESIITNNPSYNPATTESSLTLYVGQIINVLLGLLATIFIILLVLAGYNYMNAGGDDKKVSSALGIIKTAIIGLIITAGSYAIWQFLFVKLLTN